MSDSFARQTQLAALATGETGPSLPTSENLHTLLLAKKADDEFNGSAMKASLAHLYQEEVRAMNGAMNAITKYPELADTWGRGIEGVLALTPHVKQTHARRLMEDMILSAAPLEPRESVARVIAQSGRIHRTSSSY